MRFPTNRGPAASIHTLPSRGTPTDSNDQIVINFPNLPDDIQLDRDTEWRVHSNQMMPDGIHIYQHTTPMTIPLTFKLSAFDDYAVSGPETIVEIAARLHALTLPIITGNIERDVQTRQTTSDKKAGDPSPPAESDKEKDDTSGVGAFAVSSSNKYYFPPACVLDLMVGSAGATGLGIRCIGYVKNVSVTLKGPWLSSENAAVNRNLPSYGEFKLVFVHVPGYSNSVDFLNSSSSPIPQVGASQVRDLFYNSLDMLTQSDMKAKPGVDTNKAGNTTLLGYKGLGKL